ncbi:MAG: MFS transporter [Prevotella sp.]|nr:MFS transporter [Prevotella sp.]
MANQNKKLVLIPLMLCFFCMGFVDLVGTAADSMKTEFNLTNTEKGVLPMLVFLWFFIFSVPTGMLMNKIGRKKTVMLSLAVTLLALVLPLIAGSTLWVMYIALSLLGIGNALMQTSLNPLVSAVTGGSNLASTLTFGQFVKAIASFSAPLIAAWGASTNVLGLSWHVLFVVFLAFGIIATALLGLTHIDEEPIEGKPSSFVDCLKLLGVPVVLLSFLGIVCHVGIDVGVNAHAPSILMERVGIDGQTTDDFKYATSIYFAFRTLGCLMGAAILSRFDNRKFFIVSVVMLALAMVGLGVGTGKWIIWVSLALVGFGNSNLFSIVFAQALQSVPEKKNEVSGLMIMGLVGGALFPLLMGIMCDAMGQVGAVIVMAVGVLYLFAYARKLSPLS